MIGWLNAPLEGREPVTLGVAEPFTTSIAVSLYAAFGLALPVILWQAWANLASAFDERRPRTIVRLVLVASLLLAGGMAFAYERLLPPVRVRSRTPCSRRFRCDNRLPSQ